jgi:hypothetical protein
MPLPSVDPTIPANADIPGGDIEGALTAFWGSVKPYLGGWDASLHQDMVPRPWFRAQVADQLFQKSTLWNIHGKLSAPQTNAPDLVSIGQDTVTLTAGMWYISCSYGGIDSPSAEVMFQALANEVSFASDHHTPNEWNPGGCIGGVVSASEGPFAWGVAPVWGDINLRGSIAGFRVA